MYIDGKVLIGKNSNKELFILPNMANRHGLITGASGSGKTITLKVMAESFSSMGVPVFLSDIKGDLSGTCMPGESNEKIEERLNSIGIDNFDFKGFPVIFWDVFKRSGHPIRTSIQSVGATILSRMLGLNETQEAVLAVIFRIAKEEGYEIIDIKDLRTVLQYVSENSKEYSTKYGNVASQSIGSIQRSLIALEEQGGNDFFGEPAIDVKDFFNVNDKGLGNINILHCVELYKNPNLYACFLLWILTTLNNTLPEVGDMDKPKMVFFFDEAHLLFADTPKLLMDKIEQVVKLIRSKGVGIYFVTQNPRDIPDGVLAQLGNKIQHALRAYTPSDMKAVKAAADSFRENPAFKTADVIQELGTGEAVCSLLDEDGTPTVVEKVSILPPQSLMGGIDDSLREKEIKQSVLYSKYYEAEDPDSAYEFLERKGLADAEAKAKLKAEEEAAKAKAKEEAAAAKAKEKEEAAEARKKKQAAKSVGNAVAGTVGREVGKTFGGKFGKFGKTLGGNLGASLGRGILSTLFKV